MLPKKEFEVLSAAYRSGTGGKYLVSTEKLRTAFGLDDERKLLGSLSEKGLVDVIYTDRHGEPYVYIKITNAGAEKVTSKRKKRREIGIKVAFACVSALVTYIFGKLLYLIFR